jgi:hypothetical protein
MKWESLPVQRHKPSTNKFEITSKPVFKGW